MRSRFWMLACGVAGLTSLASTSSDAAKTRSSFGLVQAFQGRTYGVGAFSAPLFGIHRTVRTTLTGSLSGRQLTVFEKIDFTDGERQRKTWRFTKVAPGEWVGRRADVVGLAKATEQDGVVTLTYDAHVSSSALGDTVLSFYDVIYRRADGKVVNETTVSKFGIPVGSVSLLFRR
ncbi:MAG: DUF3833 domain-containing protein [Hyphomicrobium sp.]|nr:DUF3833 domain-containing protein [Hyphomicrobium sp.]